MIAIHAAKGFPLDARALCAREPFATALRRDGLGGLALLSPHKVLPRGVVVAIATLVDVVPTDGLWIPRLGLQEQAFGDYGPNRHAWLLDDVVRLPEPVPANGALGLWNLHVTAEALVVRALAATVS